MSKRSLFRKIRHEISVRLRPVLVLDLESLARVLTDHEKRLKKIEQHLGLELAIREVNNTKKTNKKKGKSKK
jgi:hypothetical protein